MELSWLGDNGTIGSVRSGVSFTPVDDMASFFLGVQTFFCIPLGENKERKIVSKFLIGTGLDFFIGGRERQITTPSSSLYYGDSETFKVKTTVLQVPVHFLLGASVTFKEQLELYCLFGSYLSFESMLIQVAAYSEDIAITSLGFTLPQFGFRVWF